MQALPIQFWRNRTLVESTISPTLKRFDTAPDLGIEVFVGALPYSLAGASVIARMRFQVTLLQKLVAGSKVAVISRDSKLRVNDVVVFGSERITITAIDSVSDPAAFRCSVLRNQANTQPETHEYGTVGSVLVIERAGIILSGDNTNRVYLPWLSSADTSRIGSFELEFVVSESTGVSFSIPTSPVTVTIVSDFNGR
jgi:hypothetical protein